MASRPMTRLVCPPCRMRESRSRPLGSVPSRWPSDSGGSELSRSTPRTGSGSGSTRARATGITMTDAQMAPSQILIVLCAGLARGRERRSCRGVTAVGVALFHGVRRWPSAGPLSEPDPRIEQRVDQVDRELDEQRQERR